MLLVSSCNNKACEKYKVGRGDSLNKQMGANRLSLLCFNLALPLDTSLHRVIIILRPISEYFNIIIIAFKRNIWRCPHYSDVFRSSHGLCYWRHHTCINSFDSVWLENTNWFVTPWFDLLIMKLNSPVAVAAIYVEDRGIRAIAVCCSASVVLGTAEGATWN